MYTVKNCTYSTAIGDTQGYIIESTSVGPIDLMWVNRYLHQLAHSSDKTAYQYAHRLCRFLAFLERRGKSIWSCTDDDIVKYMRSLQYDVSSDLISIVEQRLSPQALAAYYYPIRGLYIYLFQSKQTINVEIKLVMKYKRDRYLQGIAAALPSPDIVMEESFQRGAPAREYIKWYSEEEKESILNALHTLRDKAIFSISLDGFRINEILSSRKADYDKDTAVLTPYKSKRKVDGSEERKAPLSERSVKLLEAYLINERDIVEMNIEERGGRMSDNIFVVLKNGRTYGQPLNYNSFWQTLKRAAKRAKFDETKIRTHSGRSTRANEVFTDFALHPDRWTEREILDLFGWSSMRSAKPYINKNDPERMKATAKKLEEINNERKKDQEMRDEK